MPHLYKIIPETRDGKLGYQICLDFRGQLLPLPDQWYWNSEIATLKVTYMEQEDRALMSQERIRK